MLKGIKWIGSVDPLRDAWYKPYTRKACHQQCRKNAPIWMVECDTSPPFEKISSTIVNICFNLLNPSDKRRAPPFLRHRTAATTLLQNKCNRLRYFKNTAPQDAVKKTIFSRYGVSHAADLYTIKESRLLDLRWRTRYSKQDQIVARCVEAACSVIQTMG